MSEMDTSSLMSGEGKPPAACRSRPSALPRLYGHAGPASARIYGVECDLIQLAVAVKIGNLD